MRRLVVAALVLVAVVAQAGEKAMYTLNAQSVTDAGVAIPFTDNGTGGSGKRIVAQVIFIKNDGTTNEVYCNIRSTLIASTSDRMIPFGEGYTFEASPNNDDGGFFGIGCITATAETTTIRVWAQGR